MARKSRRVVGRSISWVLRLGFLLVVMAGLAVTGARLGLAFVLGDGIQVSAGIETWVFAVAGVSTAVVLTVGNAGLAHVLADTYQSRGLLWYTMLVCWLAFLAGSVELAAPVVVRGLVRSDLSTVLVSSQSQWLWAVTSIMLVEILIGASMIAHVQARRAGSGAAASSSAGSGAVSLLARAVAQRLGAELQPAGDGRYAGAEPAVPAAVRTPCRYAEFGCGKVLSPAGLKAHEWRCTFAPERHNGHEAAALAEVS